MLCSARGSISGRARRAQERRGIINCEKVRSQNRSVGPSWSHRNPTFLKYTLGKHTSWPVWVVHARSARADTGA